MYWETTRAPWFIGAAVSLAITGCGTVAEKLGRVAGKVTYQGQPVAEAAITFEHVSQGVAVTAPLNAEGAYVVQTAKGHGLPLGTYKVSIASYQPFVPLAGTGERRPKPKEYPNIPKKYRDGKTSGLTLTVQHADNIFDVDMQP